MTVAFNQQRCSVCELCVTACPPRAMKIKPVGQIFFE
jgi:Fe-S-cluster-containing hydrogenase component 2